MRTLTTGQLAKQAQVNVETIRYYERKYPWNRVLAWSGRVLAGLSHGRVGLYSFAIIGELDEERRAIDL